MRTNRRAWNNGLANIDGLMAWLYDQEILNKGERAKKDSIFRQYHRYYNDGDAPRGVLSKYGVSMYQKNLVEEKLELYLSSFISTVLAKYAGKYNRQDFYLDRKVSRLKDLLSVTERYDAYSIDYWAGKTKSSYMIALANQLKLNYDLTRGEFDQNNEGLKNTTLSYAMENDKSVVTEKFVESYRDLIEAMIDFTVIIKTQIAKVEAQIASRKV